MQTVAHILGWFALAMSVGAFIPFPKGLNHDRALRSPIWMAVAALMWMVAK